MFGMYQPGAAFFDTDTGKKLYSLGHSGYFGKDWVWCYNHWVQSWAHHAQLIVGGYQYDPMIPIVLDIV